MTVKTTCECGNEDDFKIRNIRYMVRKEIVDKDELGNNVYKIRGQLLITLVCPACNLVHPVYINRLDESQFKIGDEPNLNYK